MERNCPEPAPCHPHAKHERSDKNYRQRYCARACLFNAILGVEWSIMANFVDHGNSRYLLASPGGLCPCNMEVYIKTCLDPLFSNNSSKSKSNTTSSTTLLLLHQYSTTNTLSTTSTIRNAFLRCPHPCFRLCCDCRTTSQPPPHR